MSRPVPWADEAEWRDVHLWLYSDVAEDRQRGVDRVCAVSDNAMPRVF